MMLRFHTQTGGATLTAQQPENNIVRTALEALAAVLGGTQSLHTNVVRRGARAADRARATIALRTQQIIGYETGVAASVADPLGGSYYVESLTDELERLAQDYLERIDAMGGAVARDRGRVLPGRDPRGGVPYPAGDRVGRAGRGGREPVRGRRRAVPELQRDLRGGDRGAGRAGARAARGPRSGRGRSRAGRRGGHGARERQPPAADEGGAAARATLGEVSDVLRAVFGEYRPATV